ncbi:MAG TPA: hypothetical protein PKZ76_03730 [Xanthomonadaceae bacterium]|nr:hypothetical protein [Xanthomonadaceae bacterium]
MKQFLLAFLLMSVSGLGACDMKRGAQVPSHVAEFAVATSEYPELMAELDSTAASFELKRIGAAPGLNELHGREVLFAAYEVQDRKERRGALTVTDIKAPGRVLLRVYEDGFADSDQRTRFVAEVADVISRFGGTLSKSDSDKQP